jgi:hypothetical protein
MQQTKVIVNFPNHHECIQAKKLNYTKITLINFTNIIISVYKGLK